MDEMARKGIALTCVRLCLCRRGPGLPPPAAPLGLPEEHGARQQAAGGPSDGEQRVQQQRQQAAERGAATLGRQEPPGVRSEEGVWVERRVRGCSGSGSRRRSEARPRP